MKKLTEEWVDKSEEDFRVIQREYHTEPPEFSAVCFHSQQCIEKYFKAVLQENNIFIARTHDLDILLESVKEIIPELADLKLELVEISSFAVEIRYPGTVATKEEAEKAILLAEKVRQIIRSYFGLT